MSESEKENLYVGAGSGSLEHDDESCAKLEEQERLQIAQKRAGIARVVFFLAIGVFAVIVLVGVFTYGAYYGCSAGEGELYGFGFTSKCMDVQVVQACNVGNDIYAMPDVPEFAQS